MQRSDRSVAFFCGTGYDFHPGKGANVDVSFSFLEKSIKKNKKSNTEISTDVSGFDGCHKRGGGLFAFGIEEPADELYNKVKAQLANDNDPLEMVITAHSRGCLSALLFAKKIQADATLRNRVKITLDLRDPVPGNLRAAATLDVAGITTVSGELFDMSAMTCIEAAHITIQEEGFIKGIGFDVLIPKFPANTKLEVEYIPGVHDIQQCPSRVIIEGKIQDFQYSLPQYGRLNSQMSDNALLLLGFCKSLELYLTHGFSVSIKKLVKCLNEFTHLTFREHTSRQLEILQDLNNLANQYPEANDAEKKISLLKHMQVKLYDLSLSYIRERDLAKNPLQSRGIHFGGFVANIDDKDQATHISNRHARLSNEIRNIKFKDAEVKTLFNFKGKRQDVDPRDVISRHYDDLVKQCNDYWNHLLPKRQQTKHEQGSLDYIRIDGQFKHVNNLKNILVDKPYSAEEMLAKMLTFKVEFDKTKAFFTGSYGAKFKSNVLNVFLSIVTLGVYAAVRAIDSKISRGYFAFWKQRKEVFLQNGEEDLAAIKKFVG